MTSPSLDPRPATGRVVAALAAFAWMAAAPVAPETAREARADCLPGVPAPAFFSAGLVTSFPAGNEFLGRVRFNYFADDFTGFFTPLPAFPTPADDRGVDGLEFEFRDVTASGAFRFLARRPFNRFSIADYTHEVVMTEAPASPDPDLLYLGRTYTFRMRAVALGLGTDGARDPAVPPTCTFPWSAESTISTPSDEVSAPGLSVTAANSDFGDVELGFEARRNVTVRNGDAVPMTVKLTKSKAPFTHGATSPVTLQPEESRSIEVTFSPGEVGAETLEFRAVGPKGVAPASVVLTGRGTAATPRLSFSRTTVDFGKLRGSAREMVTVTNLTTQTVEAAVSAPRIPFYLRSAATITLAPQAVAFVEIEFIPRSDRVSFDGSIEVSVENIRESPAQTIGLTGSIANTMVVKATSDAPGGRGVEWRILPGDWTPLLAGQELPEGAEIACDPDANVELEMPDGTKIDMGAGTQIKVSAFFKKGGKVEAEILAAFGSIISRVPRHDVVRSDFKIRSPTATASVRGTEFTTIVDQATGDTTYRVTEGTLAVKPTAKRSKTILVNAGQQVTVTAAGAGPITPYIP